MPLLIARQESLSAFIVALVEAGITPHTAILAELKAIPKTDSHTSQLIYHFAYQFISGDSVEKDPVYARQLYQKASQMNDEIAMFAMGVMWETGIGGEQDYATALQWYIKADEGGWFRAPSAIGHLYAKGLGVEQNLSKAFSYFLRGTEQGDEKAMYNAGISLLHGDGAHPNETQGMKYLHAAYHKGFHPAIHAINQYYDNQIKNKETNQTKEADKEQSIHKPEIRIKNLWNRPVYLPYFKPGLTDEMVKGAEQQLGYKLPQAYIKILKEQNGGTINYTFPDYDLQLHTSIFGIGPNYPNIVDERLPLLDSAPFVSFDVSQLLPFDGDGHWYICMDYRNNKTEPEVTFVDMEEDIARKVANDFSEYLSKLAYHQFDHGFGDDYSYVIDTDVPIQQVVEHIQKRTGIILKNNSTKPVRSQYQSISGYPSTTVWTNKTSFGSMNENDEVSEDLKPLLELPAVRYIELPETALFISCDDELYEQVLIKELSTDFTIRHMREYIDIIDIPTNESDDWNIYNVGNPM